VWPACGSAQRSHEQSRLHRHPVLAALAVANQDLVTNEIDVPDPQTDFLHQAYTGAVEQTQHQSLDATVGPDSSGQYPRHTEPFCRDSTTGRKLPRLVGSVWRRSAPDRPQGL